MCTIIVTIRSVLWAVMTIAASLMILVSIFTDQWLIGPTSQLQTPYGPTEESMGLFGGNNMCQPMENMLFEGECVPDFERLKLELLKEEETVLPHAWKGGIGCMVVGLAIMVLTVLLSILTPCFRHCCCCSVFTFSGSLQSFAAVLFSMGLVAYPAGWGSPEVVKMCQDSNSFVLGHCKIGGAYWMAVAGTVCTFLASSLTVFAYKSTKSHKTMYRRQDGEKFICVP